MLVVGLGAHSDGGNKWKFWKTLLSNAYCAEETMPDGGRRVVLASVPRSGSTWLRTLLEWSTTPTSARAASVRSR